MQQRLNLLEHARMLSIMEKLKSFARNNYWNEINQRCTHKCINPPASDLEGGRHRIYNSA